MYEENHYYDPNQKPSRLSGILCVASILLASSVTYAICKDSKNKSNELMNNQKDVLISNYMTLEGPIKVVPKTNETIDLRTLIVREQEKELYRENAKVIYNGKLYYLKDLYRLSNEKDSYICYLNTESYYYCDINTDAAVAINGYEDYFSYKVEELFSKFPYQSKYGALEDSVILEDDFLNGLDSSNKDFDKQFIKIW